MRGSYLEESSKEVGAVVLAEMSCYLRRRPAVADNSQIALRHFMEALSFLFSKITFLVVDLTFFLSS